MALINIQKLDFKLTDQQMASLKNFFVSLWFGVPRWLRILVFTSVIIGGVYFVYNLYVFTANRGMDTLAVTTPSLLFTGTSSSTLPSKSTCCIFTTFEGNIML